MSEIDWEAIDRAPSLTVMYFPKSHWWQLRPRCVDCGVSSKAQRLFFPRTNFMPRCFDCFIDRYKQLPLYVETSDRWIAVDCRVGHDPSFFDVKQPQVWNDGCSSSFPICRYCYHSGVLLNDRLDPDRWECANCYFKRTHHRVHFNPITEHWEWSTARQLHTIPEFYPDYGSDDPSFPTQRGYSHGRPWVMYGL